MQPAVELLPGQPSRCFLSEIHRLFHHFSLFLIAVTPLFRYFSYHDKSQKCEDPILLKSCLDQIEATIQQFGIVTEDIFNFDESGF